MSNKNSLSVCGLILGTITTMGTTLLSPQPSHAQLSPSTNAGALQDFQNRDNADTSRILNPFDLIHRSRLGNNRDMQEFSEEQRKNINSAADEYRAKQRQILQKQQAESSSDAVAPFPPSANH